MLHTSHSKSFRPPCLLFSHLICWLLLLLSFTANSCCEGKLMPWYLFAIKNVKSESSLSILWLKVESFLEEWGNSAWKLTIIIAGCGVAGIIVVIVTMRLAYQIESNVEFQQRLQFDLWAACGLVSLVIAHIAPAHTQIARLQLHRLVAIARVVVGLAHVIQVLILPRIWFHFARWSRLSRVGVTRHSISAAEGLHSYVASFPPTEFEKLWSKKGRKSIFWRTQSSSNKNNKKIY